MTRNNSAADVARVAEYEYETFLSDNDDADLKIKNVLIIADHVKTGLSPSTLKYLETKFPEQGINIYYFALIGSGFFLMRNFPKNVPWKDFPVDLAPRYRVDGNIAVDAYRYDPVRNYTRKAPGVTIEQIVGQIEMIIFDPRWKEVPVEYRSFRGQISQCKSITESLGLSIPISIPDGHQFREFSRSDLTDFSTSTGEKFAYNYQFNSRAILGKVFKKAIESDPTPRISRISEILPLKLDNMTPGYSRAFRGAIGLQLLFDLKKHNGRPIILTEHSAVLPVEQPLRKAFTVEDEDTGSSMWAGTGKYAPVKYPEIGVRVAELIEDGYIDINETHDRLVLTEFGEHFLSLIHPDCEDPDVLNRWPDVALDPKVTKARDVWITKHFRKMKAYLETGGGGSKWKV